MEFEERGKFIGVGATGCAFRNLRVCGHEHLELVGEDFVAKILRFPLSDRNRRYFHETKATLDILSRDHGVFIDRFLVVCEVRDPSLLPPQWESETYCRHPLALKHLGQKPPVWNPDGFAVYYQQYGGESFIRFIETHRDVWRSFGALRNVFATVVALAKMKKYHGDIRLQNIVVDKFENAKLIDAESIRNIEERYLDFAMEDGLRYITNSVMRIIYEICTGVTLDELTNSYIEKCKTPDDFDFDDFMAYMISEHADIAGLAREVPVKIIFPDEASFDYSFSQIATNGEIVNVIENVLRKDKDLYKKKAFIITDIYGSPQSMGRGKPYFPFLRHENRIIYVNFANEKGICPFCTFRNTESATMCEVCATALGGVAKTRRKATTRTRKRSRSRTKSRKPRRRRTP